MYVQTSAPAVLSGQQLSSVFINAFVVLGLGSNYFITLSVACPPDPAFTERVSCIFFTCYCQCTTDAIFKCDSSLAVHFLQLYFYFRTTEVLFLFSVRCSTVFGLSFGHFLLPCKILKLCVHSVCAHGPSASCPFMGICQSPMESRNHQHMQPLAKTKRFINISL